jgi:hypothetical protein
MGVTRRELIIATASLPLAAQPQHGHSDAPPDVLLKTYQPRFFAAEDFQALEAFCEILIPTDDTPGAREARCAHYIDFLVNASADDVQQQWRSAMTALREGGFHAADRTARAALIEAMSKPERDRAATHPLYSTYRLIKQQNTFAFYTSRAGLIEALDYRGNSYNLQFPACTHPEHHKV